MEKILEIYKNLNINEVSSNAQKKNGTRQFAIHKPGYIRNDWAIYASGYVRKLYGHTCAQINTQSRGRRILIPKEKDRLLFLLDFLIRNHLYTDIKPHLPPPPIQLPPSGEHVMKRLEYDVLEDSLSILNQQLRSTLTVGITFTASKIEYIAEASQRAEIVTVSKIAVIKDIRNRLLLKQITI